MPPDTVADPTYSIVKDREVINFLQGRTGAQQIAIQGVIDSLQFNPRPPGHEVDKTFGIEIIRIVIDGTSPKYSLNYIVKDETQRVRVIAIMEKHFS